METVAVYMRISSEDAREGESLSIGNQRAFLHNFLENHPEFAGCAVTEFCDDGYAGSSFERPAFQEMMKGVKAGKINCIIVKDLSRFGRNYLETGEYLERIFPFLGVRFIAVNDNYDSRSGNTELDHLLIPFKNLMNEAYCRDISLKVRSQLDVKRRRGEFVGAFAVYGYKKDPENKNRLAVDEFAAEVVRDIFRWKLEGVSAGDIADRLNEEGILSPAEYKKFRGSRFATPFSVNGRCLWSAAAVLRVLKNPVYAGVLIQGKNTTPSYKIKRRVEKPRKEWAVIEKAHEAIIEKEDYEIVQKVLARDTRTSPGSAVAHVFSGMVSCGECGGPMVRKTVPSGKKKYVYYVCGRHKKEKTCFPHRIPAGVLEEIAGEVLRIQTRLLSPASGWREAVKSARQEKPEREKLEERLSTKEKERERYRLLLASLYENLAEGIIDREEYAELKKDYTALSREAERVIENIRREIKRMGEEGKNIKGEGKQPERRPEAARGTEELEGIGRPDQAMAALLIDRILLWRDKRVEIVCNWRDELKAPPARKRKSPEGG